MHTYTTTKKVGLVLGPLVFFILFFMPQPEGMSKEAVRVAAITALMAIWWITEPIPIPATSLLPILLYPPFHILDIGDVTSRYAAPTIYLFIGGFFIAVTMERWNLHRRLALYTIKLVGTSPAKMTLGFMIATAFISMWVSNTATAMMMVPIGLAVISQVTGISAKELLDGRIGKHEQNFGKGLMISIAYSASIGGMATLIGTPPNIIMTNMVIETYGQTITFSQWIKFALPLVLIMLAFVWVLITKILFNTGKLQLAKGKETINEEIVKMGKITKEEISVLVVFLFIAFLWVITPTLKEIFPALSGVNDTVIAMLGALSLFLIPSDIKKGIFILDWKTAVKIPWHIVLFFGGGIALAAGFDRSGLASFLASKLSGLHGLDMAVFITIVIVFVILLTEITSNTATATLLVPVMGASAIALGIHPYATIIPACLAASFAFMLPVATPPNAVVFGSGAIHIRDMIKTGVWLDIFGTILIVIFVVYFLPVIWGIDLTQMPEWAVKGAEIVK